VSRATEQIRPAQTLGGADDGGSFAARRYFDPAHGSWIVKVLPGEFYVTPKSDEVIATILGSCVSACIRDRHAGIGGMNHFMLPLAHERGWGDDPQSTRYGNFAMEKLINELIKSGCSRERMEIKVFGGGNVTDSNQAIGTQNAEFVLRYLQAEGLTCAAQDLGGQLPRRIHYFPATGRVVRRILGGTDKAVIAREESAYANRLSTTRTSGEIQLFGDYK
jgi:chemotaxis protein CheD